MQHRWRRCIKPLLPPQPALHCFFQGVLYKFVGKRSQNGPKYLTSPSPGPQPHFRWPLHGSFVPLTAPVAAVPSQLRGYSTTRTQFGISYHAQSMPADAIFVTCHLSHLNVDSVNLTPPVKAPSSLNPIHFSFFLSPPWHPGFCPDSPA